MFWITKTINPHIFPVRPSQTFEINNDASVILILFFYIIKCTVSRDIVFPLKFRPKEILMDFCDFMTDHRGSQQSGETVSQELNSYSDFKD